MAPRSASTAASASHPNDARAALVQEASMLTELAGKIAVITGPGSGLGAAMARTFARAVIAVAALDIDEPSARQIATALADEFGVATTSRRLDVGDAGSVAEASRRVE